MAYTITSLCTEARAVLQDVKSTGSPNGTRYSDQDLIDAFNDALMQTRMRRPDVFLDIGLRNAIPQYSAADVAGGTPFPIDNTDYPALLCSGATSNAPVDCLKELKGLTKNPDLLCSPNGVLKGVTLHNIDASYRLSYPFPYPNPYPFWFPFPDPNVDPSQPPPAPQPAPREGADSVL